MYEGVEIAPDAIIEGADVAIGKGSRIGAGVVLQAEAIRIGEGAVIERGTSIRGLGAPMRRFSMGDQAFVGFGSQILCPEFAMGDYSQLHNTALATGYKPLAIGHNCWIGQSSILNCTEQLTIGNNVRIGTQSQLWTHVASGELLEGCTLFGESPLRLKDNVWIVGGAVISPGLVLERNSIVMTGSVLTRSTEPFHTYAGVPAKDVTEKLSFWKSMEPAEKAEMLRGFVDGFKIEQPDFADSIIFLDAGAAMPAAAANTVVVAERVDDWEPARSGSYSLFDLSSKHYLKQRSPAEIAWMRWINGYRARFMPLEES